MRKLSKAAVAAAVIASVGFIATGTATTAATAATAQGAVAPRGGCVDILGEVGIANGLAGNLLNGEGSPGAQFTEC
ncbi:hypothetical protein SRB17_39620 [Streptomyces sp. RB17]|uniref:hypothetical protein n=1 Tax=Streptomyces sp. RB17 TaxID=2585197 RepID=UPI001296A783|nr:hypothetical protein [Streptomyces sp. RB17]MQY35966.1 hypothetical protein [Streptomyces sp. RB17]